MAKNDLFEGGKELLNEATGVAGEIIKELGIDVSNDKLQLLVLVANTLHQFSMAAKQESAEAQARLAAGVTGAKIVNFPKRDN